MLKYLTSFFKRVLNKEPVSSTPAISWKDILKEERAVVSQKKRRSMLLPSNRVLLWRTEEPQTEKDKKKNTQTGLNILFQFTYDDIPYVVKTQKAFDLELSPALNKISALIKKKVFKDKADTSENGLSIKLSPFSEHLVPENATINTLADNVNINSLLINDSEFQVIRNGVPISSVNLSLTPIADQLCMPTIVFNDKKTSVESHWFVKNEIQKENADKQGPTKKDIDALYLSFIDEGKRLYSLNGYTFKSKGTYFTPSSSDIGRLVAVVVDTGIERPVYASISSRPIVESPEDLITDDQVKWCKENKLDDNEKVIRVMSYNILADLYLNLNLEQKDLFFNYCPKANQRIFYRTPIFLKQIRDFVAAQVSIFFLQEVDIRRHESYIEPFLKTVNFSSEMSKKSGQISEGVALIYDQSKFRLINSNTFGLADLVEYDEVNEDIHRILKSSPDSENRFKTRLTVLQIVILEDIKTGTILICGNTHLHHNPLDEHVKVLQALVCLRKLMDVYNKRRISEPERNVRLVFGGDFNSTPGGAVFHLITKSFLPKDHEVWKCDEKIVAEDIRIEKEMNCLTGTPEYTNYTASSQKEGFVGCLDYIWGIEVDSIRICPLPDHEKVTRYTALPSPISPSDHLPIICDIKL